MKPVTRAGNFGRMIQFKNLEAKSSFQASLSKSPCLPIIELKTEEVKSYVSWPEILALEQRAK